MRLGCDTAAMSDPSATPPQPGQTTGRFNQADLQAAVQSGAAPGGDASGVSGMFQDPSTLAATGLIAAVAFAAIAGLLNFLGSDFIDVKARLFALTDTVDVGDVALLGIAVVLLLVTPDPPGGIERSTLLRVNAVLAAVIAGYGLLRCLIIAIDGGDFFAQFAAFLATLGVALASATVAFYAAKESFLKKEGKI